MMDESELRRRFAQLREADSDRAPSFAQTYGRAHARYGRRPVLRVRPLVISAAAAVLIAAIWIGHERSLSPAAATTEIGTWRAPTDVLLRTPGSELLGEMPALGRSILDEMMPLPSNKGT